MTTPPPTPVMTLDETIEHARRMAGITSNDYWRSTLHYLEAGKRDDDEPITREWLKSVGFQETPHELYPENDPDLFIGDLRVWEFNGTGRWLFWHFDSLAMETRGEIRSLAKLLHIELTPQPSQQSSPPAPYYTADGQPLQYHEVSGGRGCGAIPVEPPKQEGGPSKPLYPEES